MQTYKRWMVLFEIVSTNLIPCRTLELPTAVRQVKKLRFETYSLSPNSSHAETPASSQLILPSDDSQAFTAQISSPGSSVSFKGPLAAPTSPSLQLSPQGSMMTSTLKGFGGVGNQLKLFIAENRNGVFSGQYD